MKVDTCTHSLLASPTSSVWSFVRGSWPAETLLVVCLPSSENAGELNHASGSGQPEKGSGVGDGEVRDRKGIIHSPPPIYCFSSLFSLSPSFSSFPSPPFSPSLLLSLPPHPFSPSLLPSLLSSLPFLPFLPSLPSLTRVFFLRVGVAPSNTNTGLM